MKNYWSPFIAFFCLLFICSICQQSHGHPGTYACGENRDTNKGLYPFNADGDTITVKLIYVAFPGDAISSSLFEYPHQAVVDTVAWYFEEHEVDPILWTGGRPF